MKQFIKWHKGCTNKFMNKTGMDSYQLAWFSWVKGLITGIILMMLSNKNLNDKITSINKNYKSLLLEENYKRENKMIDLIFKKIHNDDIEVDKKDLLSIMSDSDSEDIDIISYNSWLGDNM